MTFTSFLNANPTRQELKKAMVGNLCRFRMRKNYRCANVNKKKWNKNEPNYNQENAVMDLPRRDSEDTTWSYQIYY